jgi:hypothetical protein
MRLRLWGGRPHSTKTSGYVGPIVAAILAFLASSHHWLHMGVLLIMGGSMGAMGTVLWLRRLMIVATLVILGLSTIRLVRHRPGHVGARAVTLASVSISLGFIVYTLHQFGW